MSQKSSALAQTTLHVDELRALAEAGQAIVQARLDEDQLCELILQHATRLMDTANFHLGLFEQDDFVIKVWIKDGVRQPAERFERAATDGIVGWLREHRQPLLVHDFLAEMDSLPARPSYHTPHPPRSALFVPILAGETAIGSLAVQSFQPHAFDENNLRLLFVIACQAGIALVNARLYQVVERRARQLQTVAEVSRKVAAILDLDELLREVVELISGRFNYYHVQIFLVAQGTDRAYFRASSGHQLNDLWRSSGRFVLIGKQGIIGWVAQHGEALLANDVSKEARYIPDDPRLLPDTRAELCVPLKVEDRVLGVLDVQARELDAFTSEDLLILTMLADQVAVAVEDARLYRAATDEAAISTSLLEVANAIALPLRLSTLASTVARLTPSLAGVDRCTVLVWHRGTLDYEVLASECRVPEQAVSVGAMFSAADVPLLAKVCHERQPITVDDTTDSDLIPRWLREQLGSQALLSLPLIVQDEVLGVLIVDDINTPHMFTNRQVEILRGIASQLAVAIESARLIAQEAEHVRMAEELRLAHEIQASFLPATSPRVAGYDIAHVWMSAREVAGDFFDFIPLPGRRLGLAVGDVSDKGVPAALYMALARTLTRVVAKERSSPAKALRRLNELLLVNSRSDLFVSLWYAVLDPQQHVLTFANAGHNPPILISARDHSARLLRRHGLILGALPAITLQDESVALEEGDVLIIYTDGVTDAMNESEVCFELTRLTDVATAHCHESAAAIATAIKAEVDAFVGNASQFDDLTLVVVKRPLPAQRQTDAHE